MGDPIRKRWFAALVFTGLFAIAAAAAWFLLNRPRELDVLPVTRGPAAEIVYATGFVEAEHPVSVSSRITAPVERVLVEEGERVTRGQPLVRLDASEQRALIEQARAEARARTLAEERITALHSKGWVTKAAHDEAVAAAASARALLAAGEARLDQLTLRSGIDGIVLRREVEPGDLAMPGRTLLELGDPAEARVSATVDERDITRVLTGQRALLSSSALGAKPIEGRVVEITPAGDPSQRAFRVRIAFDEAVSLPFGLTLEVNILTTRRNNAVLAPASAVADGAAWLVSDGRIMRRPVQVGIAGGEKVEILSGLAPGDLVVSDPPGDLVEGERVRQR
ncbi:efflux RND transporter periplasmic adaptor subunit [Erythrobacter sp.]|uniref:efflux RND transporter periplasmic adaptor subunit n=1 Tax=Erythrobacter sp. TaxID=1042 RepID=UPI001425FEF7|nr:efflux RND transporter periplasmic adaptor subunit [Erythrobacter sp.]QIQ85705.1 MAG: efflux RND transporter periplasmic adaptor subunit [Erythrobacter sp.]